MVKHTQTIRREKPTNCFSVFDHLVGLALKGLRGLTVLMKLKLFKYKKFFCCSFLECDIEWATRKFFSDKNAKAYSKPSQTSEMELFVKIVNGFQPLTFFH